MESIIRESFKIGAEALKQCTPQPVTFYSADLSGNQIGASDYQSEGNCGGAYIKGIKYRSPLYKYFNSLPNMKLEGVARMSKDVYSGYTLSFETNKVYNGQSYDRYSAFYNAVVSYLKDNGLECYVKSYLT